MATSNEPKLTSLSEHPTAGPAIRRAKAIGGLVGFGIAVLVGLQIGQPFAPMALRAVELGLAGNLVAWAVSVAIWRRLLAAQATVTVREVQEERRRRLAELEAETQTPAE
ncbi:MAG TPA: hypothetical protein VHC45_08980 [Gaiellaceae bacterium]|jgi:uncharacterized membrane protein YccC|nr:hypothetical protein [Gaiellaceae bacterium]